MSRKEHSILHGKEHEKFILLICANCGIEFKRKSRNRPYIKGYKNSFCSRKCNGIYNGFKHALVSPHASNVMKG